MENLYFLFFKRYTAKGFQRDVRRRFCMGDWGTRRLDGEEKLVDGPSTCLDASPSMSAQHRLTTRTISGPTAAAVLTALPLATEHQHGRRICPRRRDGAGGAYPDGHRRGKEACRPPLRGDE